MIVPLTGAAMQSLIIGSIALLCLLFSLVRAWYARKDNDHLGLWLMCVIIFVIIVYSRFASVLRGG